MNTPLAARPGAAVTATQAEALGITTSDRVHRWRRRGQVLVRGKIGKQDLYSVDDLRELNEKAEQDPRARKVSA